VHCACPLMGDRDPYLSRQYFRRTRQLTNAVVASTAVGCLLYDWDSYLGTNDHVFSGIRPTVRACLDWVWGVSSSPAAQQQQQQEQQQLKELPSTHSKGSG